MADLAISRAGYFLLREAKNHKADLYIGHNLGALPATVKAAKANKKPCGFDAEDFHRFEISNDKSHYDVILKTRIEDRYIPQVDYLTASSPLIAEAYGELYPDKEPVTILNVFPADLGVKQPEINEDGPVKLFWFSQTIGPSRGIPDLVSALSLLNKYHFELHLLGYLSAENKTNFIDKIIEPGNANIHFHEPVPPAELNSFASQFDIGFALEPAFSINNDMALSNKIFTYMQAGLAIVASDTAAQSKFLEEYPGIGQVYKKGDTHSLANILLYYHQHRDKLFENRKTAMRIARNELNWEIESQKLVKLVNKF